MPTYILKLKDPKDGTPYYMAWCTEVDSPITWGMTLERFEKYYRAEFGEAGMRELPHRLERVERTGCSGRPPFDDPLDRISTNRAGYKERKLDLDDILEWYCRRPHDGDLSCRPCTSTWRREKKVIRIVNGELEYVALASA